MSYAVDTMQCCHPEWIFLDSCLAGPSMTFINLGNHICTLLFPHLSTSWKTEGGPSSTWVGCCHLDLTLAKPYTECC
jgi:hypothetical protein